MCSRDDDRITPSHCRERCLALSGRLRTKCSNIGFVWSRLAPLLCPWINRNVEFPASLIVSLLSSALCRLNHIDCSGATRITEGKGKKIELTEFDISAASFIARYLRKTSLQFRSVFVTFDILSRSMAWKRGGNIGLCISICTSCDCKGEVATSAHVITNPQIRAI